MLAANGIHLSNLATGTVNSATQWTIVDGTASYVIVVDAEMGRWRSRTAQPLCRCPWVAPLLETSRMI